MQKEQKQKLKEEYEELKEKQKIIENIKKIQKTRNKIKSLKLKPKPRPQPEPEPETEPETETEPEPKSKPKINTFDDYFQECIKNKTIPKDTPNYLRKALERALCEYEQGIAKEKSSLKEFANKYIIKPKKITRIH